jgi:hypothetical protein
MGGQMAKNALVLWTVMLLSGCAAQQAQQPQIVRWAKPGADQTEFMRDRYACLQDTPHRLAAGTLLFNEGVFMGCMGARGYQTSSEGALAVPRGSEIYLAN